MNFEKIRGILHTDDGSLPDINFDFGQERIAADAYALIQGRASGLASEGARYWSKGRRSECPIRFGENPAIALLEGDAEGFHVVFGGLLSDAGAAIPDLGVFVLDAGSIALDYKMGPEWDEPAIIGLFELMLDLKSLADGVQISHDGNMFESDEGILLTEFINWAAARKQLRF